MDIAVCFDCSSSIAFYSQQIRRIILSILRKVLLIDGSDIRMALIEFQSHTDDWVTKEHQFTSSMDIFQSWINAVQNKGGNSNECKAIDDALNASLTLDWRSNDNVNRYHEKLVILITDGAPCNLLHNECPCATNDDLWKISDEFERQNITLVVIGIEPCVVVCDDFYCALANKTGGEYLPLINALRVLSFTIEQVILGEDTLSQLFRHLDIHADIEYNSLYNYSYVLNRARFMIEYCQTMTDIREWLYTYRHQSTELVINIESDYSEPHSPTNMFSINYLYGNASVFTSTPITDDEGYRTRLPTTASAESSFIYINGSPLFSNAFGLDWNSEIDDNSI